MNKPMDSKIAMGATRDVDGEPMPEPCAATMQTIRSGEMPGENPGAVKSSSSSLSEEELERLTNDIIQALKTVYDPEIPVDIYELGLIYRVDIDDDRAVDIDMTLTAPACPVAGEMPAWVENAVSAVEGVSHVTVNMVFQPPWTMERMSDEARVALDLY